MEAVGSKKARREFTPEFKAEIVSCVGVVIGRSRRWWLISTWWIQRCGGGSRWRMPRRTPRWGAERLTVTEKAELAALRREH